MAANQRIRIIGGKWRSRQVGFPSVDGLRPTGDRIRETLFNWLAADLPGARCLDLFSGSGALSFESLSRGAACCIALEQHPKAAASLAENKALLNAQELIILNKNSLLYLQNQPETPFNIVFVDPPFALNLATDVCALLESNHWIAQDGLIYCELAATQNDFSPPSNWQVVRNKVASGVKYILYSRIEPAGLFQ